MQTFGPQRSNMVYAARALDEMAELIEALAADDRSDAAPSEIADVVIVLYSLAERLGVDLHEQVERKMAINRARDWSSRRG